MLGLYKVKKVILCLISITAKCFISTFSDPYCTDVKDKSFSHSYNKKITKILSNFKLSLAVSEKSH